jgi:cell division protein FtsL
MATAAAALPRPRRRPRNQPVSGRSSLPVFYTVKRIDNSRLHREVNPEQRRECFALMGLTVVVFFFVFMYAWQHFQCVRYGYQIQQLKTQQAALEQWNNQLRLEHASLADPQRIDALARRTGLASPSPDQIIRVTRSVEAQSASLELARNASHYGPPTAVITSGH